MCTAPCIGEIYGGIYLLLYIQAKILTDYTLAPAGPPHFPRTTEPFLGAAGAPVGNKEGF